MIVNEEKFMDRMKNLFSNMTYESSSGRGERGFKEHHVEAIMKTLAKGIEEEKALAKEEWDKGIEEALARGQDYISL